MTEKPVKKQKMNILGILSIIVTLAIMVYSRFNHTDGTVFERLVNGVLVYGACFIGAGFAMLIFWLCLYLATMFTNAIYDENKEIPNLDNADQLLVVFFTILYVCILAGWIQI